MSFRIMDVIAILAILAFGIRVQAAPLAVARVSRLDDRSSRYMNNY